LVGEFDTNSRELAFGLGSVPACTSTGGVDGRTVGQRVVEDFSFDAAPWDIGPGAQLMSDRWRQSSPEVRGREGAVLVVKI